MRPKLPTECLMEIGETCIQGRAPFKYFVAIRILYFLSRGEFDALRLLVHNKTYQFWQHWFSLHSLHSTRDFQVRKINMVQFVNTVQYLLQVIYGIVTDHKRRNYNSAQVS